MPTFWSVWRPISSGRPGGCIASCATLGIPDDDTLTREVAEWQELRNAKRTKAARHFATADDRIN